jgi:hypothetical protein
MQCEYEGFSNSSYELLAQQVALLASARSPTHFHFGPHTLAARCALARGSTRGYAPRSIRNEQRSCEHR